MYLEVYVTNTFKKLRIHISASYSTTVQLASLAIMLGNSEFSTTNLLDGYGFQERFGVEMGWRLVDDNVRKVKRDDTVT